MADENSKYGLQANESENYTVKIVWIWQYWIDFVTESKNRPPKRTCGQCFNHENEIHACTADLHSYTHLLNQPKAIWVLYWQCNTHRNDSVLKVNLDMVFRDSPHHRLKNVVTQVRNDVLPGEPLHQYISLQKLHPSQFRHRRPLRGKIRENKQH